MKTVLVDYLQFAGFVYHRLKKMEKHLQISLKTLNPNCDLKSSNSHDTSAEVLADGEKVIIESDVTVEEDAHFEDLDSKLFSSATSQLLKVKVEAVGDIAVDNSEVQILRRSKRIPLIQEIRKFCENQQISDQNYTSVNKSSNKKGRRIVKEKKKGKGSTNTNKSVEQKKRAYFANESDNNIMESVPECIKGIFMDNDGRRIIIIKWKNKDVLDYIYEDKLTENIKEMLTSYLSNQLNELNSAPSTSANETSAAEDSLFSPEESSSLDPEIEKDSILEFKNRQQLCVEDTQLFSDCGFDDYAVDVKLNI